MSINSDPVVQIVGQLSGDDRVQKGLFLSKFRFRATFEGDFPRVSLSTFAEKTGLEVSFSYEGSAPRMYFNDLLIQNFLEATAREHSVVKVTRYSECRDRLRELGANYAHALLIPRSHRVSVEDVKKVLPEDSLVGSRGWFWDHNMDEPVRKDIAGCVLSNDLDGLILLKMKIDGAQVFDIMDLTSPTISSSNKVGAQSAQA